jgi:hypothetical protein
MEKLKVYLAGQSNEHDNNWKELFKSIEGCEFHDWEIDSDQSSPDTYFPDDITGIRNSAVMVANPGLAPSEATWVEVGYFYGQQTKRLGERCNKLIIIWQANRNPKWSIDFIKKTGIVVSDFKEAIEELKKIIND